LQSNENLVLAVPAGRILDEAMPVLGRAGIAPEPAFRNGDTRRLRFTTNVSELSIIRVRSFDVATFVAFGAAHLGIAGNDVLMEFDYPEVYAPLDLKIGRCRLSVAEPGDLAATEDPSRWSHLRVATKYPEVTRRHFAKRGVQAECIKLNGAVELAPALGLCSRIVDLVSTGATLRAHGLVEVEHIAHVTSRLIVNRAALKTRPERINGWIDRFRDAVGAASERFDGVRLTRDMLRIGGGEIGAARTSCNQPALEALALAARRIESYHRRQIPQGLDYTDEAGVRLGHRFTPVASAGLYVPGGTAAYPSTVLMNAIPARVAGVARIVVTVPAPQGRVNPLVLAAAEMAGVTEIYRVGGAQAIAALAYGTASIAPVEKVVGPGNAYVVAAKRLVAGVTGTDAEAGPSEVLIVADASNDPAWIAADLLAQAEHDADAQSILITDNDAFARAVEAEIAGQLLQLPRAGIARKSWERHGAVIIVRRLEDAAPLVDRLAPEHLELAVAAPDALAAKVRNAGAIFLGRYSPEAIGDYVAGPSHVLPTSRTARFSSGLGVADFLKRTSLIGCDAAALARIGPAAIALAEAEGLDAHALSVAIRLGGSVKG
jgi:histidinol dehydrogenase